MITRNYIREMLDEIPLLMLIAEDLPEDYKKIVRSKIADLNNCLVDLYTKEVETKIIEAFTKTEEKH